MILLILRSQNICTHRNDYFNIWNLGVERRHYIFLNKWIVFPCFITCSWVLSFHGSNFLPKDRSRTFCRQFSSSLALISKQLWMLANWEKWPHSPVVNHLSVGGKLVIGWHKRGLLCMQRARVSVCNHIAIPKEKLPSTWNWLQDHKLLLFSYDKYIKRIYIYFKAKSKIVCFSLLYCSEINSMCLVPKNVFFHSQTFLWSVFFSKLASPVN